MKKLLLTSTLFLISLFSFAQAPTIEWQKTFGGTGIDVANSIQKTNDGGYIVAGYSSSSDSDVTVNHGDKDYWVVKLSVTGAIEWEKSYGGTAEDQAYQIQQTTDGGYIVAGHSLSNNGDVTGNHGEADFWVVKLFSTGMIDWQKSLGGSALDMARSIQQTTDGGYIVAGRSESSNGDLTLNHGWPDMWVVKLSSSGTIDWQHSLGGTDEDFALSIKQTSDGGYIVGGYSLSNNGDVTGNHGLSDYWLVKLYSTGIIEWQKTFGGTGYEFLSSVQQTSDSGYIMSGRSISNNGDVSGNHGDFDYWVVKVNSAASIEWQKSYGGSNEEEPTELLQTTDGGYILTGRTLSNNYDVTVNHGLSDCWVVKINNLGTLQWQKSLGGTDTDWSTSIQQTTDGNYIVGGYTFSNDVDVTGNNGNWDYWVVKLNYPSSGSTMINDLEGFLISPNPADEFLTIKNSFTENETVTVKIFDVSGREIYSSIAKTSNLKLGTRNLENGIYFCQLISGDKIFNQKFIVQH